ncbi:arachidonate 5-lipoxygenase-activating protein isoform X2 [Neofelis nebulosa]|uniref:arachidonate 5-lipoxygenase-activating protein isoform X2 n=1 Tax=Neofelis nebulosa TaxID=61452 RepID=UPI00272AF324|nr:arachidonate 5-lipoxygenase-activating protein isoform X2 [Neofelis nebulosa]
MDQETVGNIVLLAIVTLISVVQNGFFAHKVEHESKTQNGRSFQRTGTLAFERVYTAKVSSRLAAMLTHLDRGPVRPIWTSDLQMICLVLSPDVWGYLFSSRRKRMQSPCALTRLRQNCVDAYPTFLVVLWSAGLLCSQVPAAFAGLMYLFVRQKYFVGYLGERTQSTPGHDRGLP